MTDTTQKLKGAAWRAAPKNSITGRPQLVLATASDRDIQAAIYTALRLRGRHLAKQAAQQRAMLAEAGKTLINTCASRSGKNSYPDQHDWNDAKWSGLMNETSDEAITTDDHRLFATQIGGVWRIVEIQHSTSTAIADARHDTSLSWWDASSAPQMVYYDSAHARSWLSNHIDVIKKIPRDGDPAQAPIPMYLLKEFFQPTSIQAAYAASDITGVALTADDVCKSATPLPELRGVVETPYVYDSGDDGYVLVDTHGYNSDTKLFLWCPFYLPDLPIDDIKEAIGSLIGEIKFAGRPMIDTMNPHDAAVAQEKWVKGGWAKNENACAWLAFALSPALSIGDHWTQTNPPLRPMACHSKPLGGQGTGATYSAQLAVSLTQADVSVQPHISDINENRKSLMSAIGDNPTGSLILDNATAIGDPTLASLLTSSKVRYRRLHSNESSTIKFAGVIHITANDPSFDTDIFRRMLRIRLDGGETPDQNRFLDDPLDTLTRNRGWAQRIVAELLSYWLDGGGGHTNIQSLPQGTRNSYTSWARHIHAILTENGITAFNPAADSREDDTQGFTPDEIAALFDVIQAWRGSDTFTSAIIADAAKDKVIDLSYLTGRTEAQLTSSYSWGKLLSRLLSAKPLEDGRKLRIEGERSKVRYFHIVGGQAAARSAATTLLAADLLIDEEEEL